jgi:hypothetical protein
MPKPNITLARWATGPGQDVLVPSSGLRDTGFVNGTPAVPGYVNELLNQLYLWAVYLDTGDLDGDFTVDGSLEVGSELIVGGTLTANQDVSVVGLVEAQGTIRGEAGLQSGGDMFHEGTQFLTIPGSMSIDANGTHTKLLGSAIGAHIGWTLASSTDKITYPIALELGDHIKSLKLFLNKGSNGSNTITARIYRVDNTNDEQALGSGVSTSANAPGDISISESGLDLEIEADWQYYLVLTPAAGGAGDLAFHAEIGHNRPPP